MGAIKNRLIEIVAITLRSCLFQALRSSFHGHWSCLIYFVGSEALEEGDLKDVQDEKEEVTDEHGGERKVVRKDVLHGEFVVKTGEDVRPIKPADDVWEKDKDHSDSKVDGLQVSRLFLKYLSHLLSNRFPSQMYRPRSIS